MDIVNDCNDGLLGRVALLDHGICTCTPYEVDQRIPSLQTILASFRLKVYEKIYPSIRGM